MIDDYGSKLPDDQDCEAQILRLKQYVSDNLFDFLWRDGLTYGQEPFVEFVIAVLDALLAEVRNNEQVDAKAQIMRLSTYLAASMPDFIWKDGSTADVAIAVLSQLSAEVERLRRLSSDPLTSEYYRTATG